VGSNAQNPICVEPHDEALFAPIQGRFVPQKHTVDLHVVCSLELEWLGDNVGCLDGNQRELLLLDGPHRGKLANQHLKRPQPKKRAWRVSEITVSGSVHT
jgi:hypothetical protein